MTLKRPNGIRIKDHVFNRKLLTRLLVESKYKADTGVEVTAQMVNTWFGEGEEDAQNVPAVTQLLRAIASFRSLQASAFSEERRALPTFSAQLWRSCASWLRSPHASSK